MKNGTTFVPRWEILPSVSSFMTNCVVMGQAERRYRVKLTYSDSVTAWSIRRMGMPSLMGYARRHSAHFRLFGVRLRNVSGFLHAGQTKNIKQILRNHASIPLAPRRPTLETGPQKKTIAVRSLATEIGIPPLVAQSDRFGYNCIVPQIHGMVS